MVKAGLIAGDPAYYSGGYATPTEYLVALDQIISSGVVSRATALAHVPALANAPHTNP